MGQGTAMFDCVSLPSTTLRVRPTRNISSSVIVLTDGEFNKGAKRPILPAITDAEFNLPIYAIAFGDADFGQLDQFKMTGGDVYDGRQDVAAAFRLARGNN